MEGLAEPEVSAAAAQVVEEATMEAVATAVMAAPVAACLGD